MYSRGATLRVRLNKVLKSAGLSYPRSAAVCVTDAPAVSFGSAARMHACCRHSTKLSPVSREMQDDDHVSPTAHRKFASCRCVRHSWVAMMLILCINLLSADECSFAVVASLWFRGSRRRNSPRDCRETNRHHCPCLHNSCQIQLLRLLGSTSTSERAAGKQALDCSTNRPWPDRRLMGVKSEEPARLPIRLI